MNLPSLPFPTLCEKEEDGIVIYTDESLFESTDIRIAFSSRLGGVSTDCYGSLNLGDHVDDDIDHVLENRRLLQTAIGASDLPLLNPNQVHGDSIYILDDGSIDLNKVKSIIAEGIDSIICSVGNVCILLCFADCVPVIIAAPDGTFAVTHAGWRGVMSRIVPKTINKISQRKGISPSEMNIYIGPHIHAECFETSEELCTDFKNGFGDSCIMDARHVDLSKAIRKSVTSIGVDESRFLDLGICTACSPEMFFSYRNSGGRCGRHGAIAYRRSDH